MPALSVGMIINKKVKKGQNMSVIYLTNVLERDTLYM